MNIDHDADVLLGELAEDSRRFVERGRGYQLLQAFFRGLPVETLRPLLQDRDPWVQRTAGFVASELGWRAADVVDDAVALLASTDIHAQNYAMDVLAVCGTGDKADLFAHVLRKLESDHGGLRVMAMYLVSRASTEQLAAAARVFARAASYHRIHCDGLRVLIAGSTLSSESIVTMLREHESLARRYGAILARRHGRADPAIIEALKLADPELQEFVMSSE